MIDCYFLSLRKETPNRDYWDYGMLEDLIAGNMWKTADFPEFKIQEVSRIKRTDKAIVVLPARHHAGLETQVNDELNKIDNVVFFAMGDEERDFDLDKIEHKSIHIWVQNPHPDKDDKYDKLGTGYPPQLNDIVDKDNFTKSLDLYFSGQVTHIRRQQMIDSALNYEATHKNVLINRTRGFTQGEPHDVYYKDMTRAKAVACPSGAVIPDSFRLFEALQCMAIPIADEVNPTSTITAYWDWLFGEITPFPKITDWKSLTGYMNNILENYPYNIHEITSWWIMWKRNFVYKVIGQLNEQ